MKNSAWYHKFWRQKLDGLPLKESPDASWADMKALLDHHMPVNAPPSGSMKLSFATKLLKVVCYVIPTVATISIIVYTSSQIKKATKTEIQKYKPKQLNVVKKEMLQTERQAIRPEGAAELSGNADKLSIRTGTKTERVERRSEVMGVSKYPKKTFVPMVKSLSLDEQYEVISDSKVQRNDLPKLISLNIKPHLNNFSIVDDRKPILQAAIVNPRMRLPIGLGRPIENNGKRKGGKKKLNTKKNKIDILKAVQPMAGDRRYTRNIKAKSSASKTLGASKNNYGLVGGFNFSNDENSVYVGGFMEFELKKNWLVAIDLNLNNYRTIAGQISHPSYFRPDSLPPFQISDTRKIAMADITFKLKYKITQHLTVNAGPIISFPIKQSAIETMLRPIADPRDTVHHGKEINYALANTSLNKVNIGMTGGISIHIKRIDINGSYQWLNSYRINNALGAYYYKNQFVRLGIGYRFN